PFDADSRVYAELNSVLLRTSLPADFVRALVVYVRAALSDDLETLVAISHWMGGADESVTVAAKYLSRPTGVSGVRSAATVNLRPIGRGTARDVMRGVLWLVKMIGAKGLVLCIDEVEELARLPNR